MRFVFGLEAVSGLQPWAEGEAAANGSEKKKDGLVSDYDAAGRYQHMCRRRAVERRGNGKSKRRDEVEADGVDMGEW